MSIIAAFTGNAGAMGIAEAREVFSRVLSDGEDMLVAFKLKRDAFAFTNRQIIVMDVQGITGKKVEWLFFPYKAISRFSIETAGVNDWDAELKLYGSGNEPLLLKKFNRKVDIYQVAAVITQQITV